MFFKCIKASESISVKVRAKPSFPMRATVPFNSIEIGFWMPLSRIRLIVQGVLTRGFSSEITYSPFKLTSLVTQSFISNSLLLILVLVFWSRISTLFINVHTICQIWFPLKLEIFCTIARIKMLQKVFFFQTLEIRQ